MKVDRKKLKLELQSILGDAFQNVIDGAADDIRIYAFAVAEEMVKALLEGDMHLQDELRFQLEAIAEINRLRLVNEQAAVVEKFTDLVMQGAAAVLKVAV